MKANYSEVIDKLEAKLSGIDVEKSDIDELLKGGVENLLRLHECYVSGNWGECRDLLGSIYPENFTIEKNEFRTARVNEVVPIIYLINNILDKNKNGTRKNLSSLSHQVILSGLFSNHFVEDLKKLAYHSG